MPEFTSEHLEAIAATTTGDLAVLAESFNQCFGMKCAFTAGAAQAWPTARDGVDLGGPGLLLSLSVGKHGIVIAIPAAFPLPDWIAKPGDSENARLQTLAMEWGMNIVPPDLDADATGTQFVENLADAIQQTVPTEGAQCVEWTAVGDEAAATSKLLIVFPVTVPQWKPATIEATAPADQTAALPSADASLESLGGRGISPIDDFRERAQRIFHLPVSVSVRLAEKKIPMGQLLSITPGALITFTKPCEDLLDLYINNSRYCRGEAVKIGEKFGLKVHEVGVVEVRKEKVL